MYIVNTFIQTFCSVTIKVHKISPIVGHVIQGLSLFYSPGHSYLTENKLFSLFLLKQSVCVAEAATGFAILLS